MVRTDTGRLITTATKNVNCDRDLSDEERSIAQSIAPLIRQSQRNWLPVYLREISTHNYQLIDGFAIWEATRLAEQKVIYCIKIDSSPETEEQIIKGQQLLNQTSAGNLPKASIDLMPLLKQIESIKQALNSLGEKTEKIHDRVVPEKTLSVNIEEERSLKAKLFQVPGIGAATLPKIVAEVLKNRPFYSEYEFKAGVTAFQAPKTKSNPKNPRHEKLWNNLTERYVLDYSKTEYKIAKEQQLLNQSNGGNLSTNNLDLISLLKELETINKALNSLGEKTEKIQDRVVADKTLSVNMEEERSL